MFKVRFLRATGLHVDHVFRARQWKFHDPEYGFANILDGVDAGAKGQQKHIEPSDEKGDGPRQQDDAEKPEDGPDEARAQVAASTTFSLCHLSDFGAVL